MAMSSLSSWRVTERGCRREKKNEQKKSEEDDEALLFYNIRRWWRRIEEKKEKKKKESRYGIDGIGGEEGRDCAGESRGASDKERLVASASVLAALQGKERKLEASVFVALPPIEIK